MSYFRQSRQIRQIEAHVTDLHAAFRQPSGARQTAAGSPKGERGGANQIAKSPKGYVHPVHHLHHLPNSPLGLAFRQNRQSRQILLERVSRHSALRLSVHQLHQSQNRLPISHLDSALIPQLVGFILSHTSHAAFRQIRQPSGTNRSKAEPERSGDGRRQIAEGKPTVRQWPDSPQGEHGDVRQIRQIAVRRIEWTTPSAFAITHATRHSPPALALRHSLGPASFSAWLHARTGLDRRMKKILPIVIVVAAAVAAAFVFLRKKPEQDMAPGRAAALAPAEAILYLEFPDIPRTGKRWSATSLNAIVQEPEWKEFGGKAIDFVMSRDETKTFFGVVNQISEADPSGFFLAFTEFKAPIPKMVGGLPYRGKKTAVTNGIGKLRELITKGFPAAKSDLVQYEGTDIETLTDTGFNANFAYRDNWFFFSTDLELIKGVLHRYTAGDKAPPGLAGDPLYAEAAKQGSAEPDFSLFVRWKKVMATMLPPGLAGAPGGPPQALFDMQPEVMSYTLKLDGPLLRDRFYTRMPHPGKPGGMTNRLLAMTTKQSMAYASFTIAPWEDQFLKMFTAAGVPPDISEAEFSKRGLKMEDLFKAFGPEVAVSSDWESGGIAIPSVFALVEVRDATKARKFAEWLVEEIKMGGELSQKEEDGTAFWTMKYESVPIIHPTIALNDKQLAFGLTYADAVAGLKQIKSGGDNLGKSPTYQEAVKTVIAPTHGILYVDVKMVFERLYEKFKPSLAFALAGETEMGKYFDAAKIPKAETISKHLRPLIFTYAETPEGYVMDCTGTVSYFSTLMPAAFIMPVFALRSMSPPAPGFAPPAPPVTPPPAVPPATPPAPTTPPTVPK
jgi:hypothetical protein